MGLTRIQSLEGFRVLQHTLERKSTEFPGREEEEIVGLRWGKNWCGKNSEIFSTDKKALKEGFWKRVA